MDINEDKTKKKLADNVTATKADLIEEGMQTFEKLLVEAFRVEASDPKLKKVIQGFRAIISKIDEIDRRGSYYSDEIYHITVL